jgi:hypothetical protein
MSKIWFLTLFLLTGCVTTTEFVKPPVIKVEVPGYLYKPCVLVEPIIEEDYLSLSDDQKEDYLIKFLIEQQANTAQCTIDKETIKAIIDTYNIELEKLNQEKK